MATAVDVLYTNTNAIRAVIGLDENDVPDSVILNQNMELWMKMELTKFLPTYEDGAAGSEDVLNRLTIWCQIWGALKLITLGPLTIPQRFQANQDQLQRFAIDWAKLESNLTGQLDKLHNDLVPDPALDSFTIMGKASRGYDPITGV